MLLCGSLRVGVYCERPINEPMVLIEEFGFDGKTQDYNHCRRAPGLFWLKRKPLFGGWVDRVMQQTIVVPLHNGKNPLVLRSVWEHYLSP